MEGIETVVETNTSKEMEYLYEIILSCNNNEVKKYRDVIMAYKKLIQKDIMIYKSLEDIFNSIAGRIKWELK